MKESQKRKLVLNELLLLQKKHNIEFYYVEYGMNDLNLEDHLYENDFK